MNLDKITEYLETLPGRGIPSVDCMIFKEHELVYRHMCGTTDEAYTKPIQGDELYIMFSMTKVQTMTAVMQLVEQGKLSLEDEVGRFLPAYQNLTVEVEGKVEKLQTPMLVKHLLSMQS
ncbi:MAG: serine hydrolase, partial [Lachnospiraceae bacterium]|nr:serine hydrolase [Lachnospiraceae bacterium]